MKIEFSDNVFGSVFVVCLLVLFLNIRGCVTGELQREHEIQRAHIDAGQCQEAWGKWAQCK